jgi:hypothetical protein
LLLAVLLFLMPSLTTAPVLPAVVAPTLNPILSTFTSNGNMIGTAISIPSAGAAAIEVV